MSDLHGKVVLITGASSGIGEAMAKEAVQKGAHVVVCARRAERLEELKRALVDRWGGRVLVAVCDVTIEADVERAVSEAVNHFGRLDVVIANAGFGVIGRFENLTNADFERQLKTNFYGVLNTVRAALPHLKTTQGRIGIMGSLVSYWSPADYTPYSVSKAALRSFATALRLELKPHNVAVTLICPGFVKSEIQKVNKLGEYDPSLKSWVPPWLVMSAERAAHLAVKAVEKRKRLVVITWYGKIIVDLAHYWPSLLDWLSFRLMNMAKGRR